VARGPVIGYDPNLGHDAYLCVNICCPMKCGHGPKVCTIWTSLIIIDLVGFYRARCAIVLLAVEVLSVCQTCVGDKGEEPSADTNVGWVRPWPIPPKMLT